MRRDGLDRQQQKTMNNIDIFDVACRSGWEQYPL
jgi:hypothetical protein